jgi:hypothetical protein
MNKCAEVASLVHGISWNSKPMFRRSQARLVQEYLRRSALWSAELGAGGWPFYDIASWVNPDVRAPANVVEEAVATLSESATFYVARTVEWALHFAALEDSGEKLPDLPDPFFPLLFVYERGDAINYSPAGFIEVDGLSVPRGKAVRYAEIIPMVDFGEEALREIDEQE